MNVNEDLNYAFAVSRQCLWILGVWPDPFVPVSNFHRPNIRFIIITCILCLYVILPLMANMILAWGNVARMVVHVASVITSILAACKLIGTWYHGEALRTLMTSIMTDWMTSKNDRERSTMLNIAKRGRTLSLRCYIITTCLVLCYLYLNLLKFYRNMHQSQRSLVYQFNYPYIQKSPNYEITFFVQILGALYTAFINTTIDSFISILLFHICGQLINLRMTLINLVDELVEGIIPSSRFKKELTAITVRHEHLIRNAKIIDECYSAILFLHMFAAIFQLCFQCFQVFTIITNHVDVSLFKVAFLSLYFVFVLTNLYNYCYSAERLLTESTSMAYAVYECKWYDLPPKNAKDLMFIIYRSTVPLRLTAGKFGTFSLEMFETTLKTSMGYLSALLTIMN